MKLFVAIVAALLLGASVAHAEPGTPIQGIPVGLEGDPGSIVAPRVTDREGNVVFADLAPGRYAVFIPDASRLQAPIRLRISADVSTLRIQNYVIVAQPGRGRAYTLDDRGQRLVVTIPRAGGRIAINASSIFDRWGRGGQTPR
ncbi:hypothetical protein [Brevundimonas sp.]|uniref:hypothetical protein n=1 Tax=Brevundimonas sp. TaxID=1871086 RepID=UPI0024870032|nr:hypothetical protein [Brevundimonas sp.]MDI1282198.1 hypothetical protein [Brevundimonas sp.]